MELEAPVSPGGPREASTEGLGRKTNGLGSTNRRSLDVKMGIVTKREPDEPMDSTTIAERLLESDEPAIRYLTRVLVLGESSTSRAARRDRLLIPSSPLVRALLSEVDGEGVIPLDPYSKWRGSHWVMAFLSELGYPAGDKKLKAMADRNARWALSKKAQMLEGRPRRCASQQSYALLYLLKLGFYDERCDELADRLIEWQWDDGGWNCDRRPEACHSSFHESLLPARALCHYAAHTGRADALRAATKAAKMFLDRRLFRRKSTDAIIDKRFLEFHYPYHWRYNLLHGLKAMAEACLVADRRCREAIDVLKSKQLPDGGFASPKRIYNMRLDRPAPRSPADFGPFDAKRRNPFVTIDALYVLRLAEGTK